MYENESVNEYIRSVLGYPNYNNVYREIPYNNLREEANIEEYYPEIYKVVYPMITKKCSQNSETITRDLIDKMADEIYFEIESNDRMRQNETQNNRTSTNSLGSVRKTTTGVKQEPVRETREETRKARNTNLLDLIKILIIRELLGRPGNRPPRPDYPGGRPHLPGGNRPPIMPRGYLDYELYERY